MAKYKHEKDFWKRMFGISGQPLKDFHPTIGRLNFRDADLDDQELNWILDRARIIEQLDLDNTLVSDDSIRNLVRLEFIRELRLKGCRRVTPASLPYLSQLKDLELLHLNGTAITLEDLSALNDLPQLKLLLVSSDLDESSILQLVAQVYLQLPNVEINVNHRIYPREI